ncbi:hypothetical protein N7522_013214 [Penicillium canescens]|uniref:Uncharacterized protein n=1 Tax=Penicillium canescens TaxID=5083 RepID=A0AAD6N1I8_PENCN|nr:uncharacterized protein N7446_012728 [Penicillium canescens]KAJ5986018.1 hypothetical protein N7522_013214 [Penicillium canescens]KAJ6022375.1 hypothetical protein N7460_012770 [Penicillium canescens]KAJ6026366.1 hypothetical protein N7444_014045 [Penicillium canescens]KAJ6041662.1 hypothetical protein N7446_012728 [Penicillium canescens]
MDRVMSAETTTFAKAAIPIPEPGMVTRINVVEVFVGDINPAQAVGKASDDPQSLAFAERSGKSPRNDAVNSILGVHRFLIVRQKSVVAGLHKAPISLDPTLCFMSFVFSSSQLPGLFITGGGKILSSSAVGGSNPRVEYELTSFDDCDEFLVF